MFKIAAAAIVTLVVCSACLTKEELDCWYDDMCLTAYAATMPPPPASDTALHGSR